MRVLYTQVYPYAIGSGKNSQRLFRPSPNPYIYSVCGFCSRHIMVCLAPIGYGVNAADFEVSVQPHATRGAPSAVTRSAHRTAVLGPR
jgi:hypothetical protein